MKNIKFRAWDKTINYMDYRVRVSHFKGSIEVLDSWSTWRELKKDEYELMQYTGLKDIHGFEIYEGDMLIETKSKDTFEVKYGWFEDADVPAPLQMGHHLYDGRDTFPFYDLDYEIIGNVYEQTWEDQL